MLANASRLAGNGACDSYAIEKLPGNIRSIKTTLEWKTEKNARTADGEQTINCPEQAPTLCRSPPNEPQQQLQFPTVGLNCIFPAVLTHQCCTANSHPAPP